MRYLVIVLCFSSNFLIFRKGGFLCSAFVDFLFVGMKMGDGCEQSFQFGIDRERKQGLLVMFLIL